MSVAILLAMVGFALLARPAAAQAERVRVTVIEMNGLLDRIQARFLGAELAAASDGEFVVIVDNTNGTVLRNDERRRLDQARRRSAATVATWDRSAEAPTLGDFLVDLQGMPTELVRRSGRPVQRQLADNVQVRFAEPPFTHQLLHAVSTPTAAYLLLTVALLLLVFELFTGGIGVAGGVAVVCLVFAAYGLGALPTSPFGLALLLAGAVGFAIDVQVGVPRAWTVIGTALFTAGSFFLFDGLRVPFPVLVIVLGAVVAFVVSGIPAVVRTRFSTPTIGRESMVGELGTATTDVAPDGVVTVRDAPWRARTNRATPIRAGDAVRVAAIDGLMLEVEPLEGAARDAGH